MTCRPMKFVGRIGVGKRRMLSKLGVTPGRMNLFLLTYNDKITKIVIEHYVNLQGCQDFCF